DHREQRAQIIVLISTGGGTERVREEAVQSPYQANRKEEGRRALQVPRLTGGTRLHALVRGNRAARPRPVRGPGRGGGLRVRDALRPLPSLDRPDGTQPVRLVGPGGGGAGHLSSPGGDRGHLPDAAHPPGRDRPGGG